MGLELTVVPAQQRTGPADRRRRKSDAVYEDMKRKILLGALTADSPITEQALAQDYSCSQSTIREALLTLQEDGLVIRRGYRGTFVTNTTNEEAIVLFRLRLSIETAVIGQVIQNMTADKMAELRQLARDYDAARIARDTAIISQADIAFHRALHRVADMPILEPVLMRTLLHLHRFVITRHTNKVVWVNKVEASHDALLNAIDASDHGALKRLVVAHATTNAIEIAPDVYNAVFAKIAPDLNPALLLQDP